jgi:hypothetical protein
MSRLSQRIAALERQTAQHRGEARCDNCRERPSSHVLITEIDADGVVTRRDTLEGPSSCPACGWGATIHQVKIVEVRDWNAIGRHGRR